VRISIRQNILGIRKFFKEVRAEIRKIDWLKPRETIQYTLIVLFVSIILAIFLGGVDFILTTLLKKFIIR